MGMDFLSGFYTCTIQYNSSFHTYTDREDGFHPPSIQKPGKRKRPSSPDAYRAIRTRRPLDKPLNHGIYAHGSKAVLKTSASDGAQKQSTEQRICGFQKSVRPGTVSALCSGFISGHTG